MRERSARAESITRGRRRLRAQRGSSRGGVRTMPRWLWAAVILAVAGAGVAAWTPPEGPSLLTPRSRRDAQSAMRHLQLLGWHLELQENRAIRSPYYDECLFYKGRVIGEESSTATVTECAGQLYGLLQVGGENFVLQPTHAAGSHVLRRRDVVLSEPPAYNLTGDTVTDLDLDLEEESVLTPMPHVRPRHTADHKRMETEYFRAEPVTRPISGVKGLWLEMAIVADHTMMKFHGQERVKHYILALMNIVSAIFNDPSLNSNMTLVINKLFLYEEKDSIIKYGNVKKSLEAVNKWNYRHLIKLPAESTAWDATVWLTRAPLGGPSGFAPVGGVCSRYRSAAIDRDEGLTSAFVIAHELAHLLGLTHDGEEWCQTEGAKGSVMAPTVLATLHNYAWSSCSKKQFHEKSKSWWCLHERSREDGVVLGGANEVSNYVFTMEEQCRTEFGEGYSVCRSEKVWPTCSELWCANHTEPLVCRSKRGAPLEGTPCGKDKWCVDRECEPMLGHGDSTRVSGRDPHSRKGPRWNEWSAWSKCSVNCGYGLRTRTQRCRHRGAGGSACEGAGSQVATCWAGRACAASRDPRADLCHRQHHALIPHLSPDESKHCENWCVEYTGGEPSNYGTLPDGTACSYDAPYDICSQGTCVKGHCNSADPVCNWCPDGYCNNNTHVYTKHLGKEWTRMVMVPHEAHQLSIHIATTVPLHIALRERKRDKPVLELSKHSKRTELHDQQDNYLKYDPNVPQNLQIIEVDSHVIDIKEGRYQWEGEVVAAGTLLRWRQTDADVAITATARLQTDLMIMAIPESSLPADELVAVTVAVNYSTPAAAGVEHARPLEYRWSLSRGPCSVSCGGGVRLVRPRCSRDMLRCPPSRYEPCNTHSCEFSWAVGEWEECSATCGSGGVHERQLYCLPANVTASTTRDMIRHSVSPALCPPSAPERQQPCNRLPCPVYWREMPWTPCSTSCGRGISRRPLMCPASDEVLCGPKPRERRRRCRLRRCSPPSRLTYVCPPSDTTQYCELFNVNDLKRHCQVAPFRKYCCNACRDIDRFYHTNRFS